MKMLTDPNEPNINGYFRHLLCLDCLAIIPFDQDGHDGKYHCACGGQWDGTTDSQFTADQLILGVRDPQRLGLSPFSKDPIEWYGKEFGIYRPGTAPQDLRRNRKDKP